MSLIRTIKFLDEFKLFNNINYFDTSRCLLLTNFTVYSLSFKCALNEATDQLNIDVKTLHSKDNSHVEEKPSNSDDFLNIMKQFQKLNKDVLEVVRCKNISIQNDEIFLCGVLKNSCLHFYKDEYCSWSKINTYNDLLRDANVSSLNESSVTWFDDNINFDDVLKLVKSTLTPGTHVASFCWSFDVDGCCECAYLAVSGGSVISLWRVENSQKYELVHVIYCCNEICQDVMMFTMQQQLFLTIMYRNGCMNLLKYQISQDGGLKDCCSNLIWSDEDQIACTNVQFCPIKKLFVASKNAVIIVLKVNLDDLSVVTTQTVQMIFKLFVTSIVCGSKEIYVSLADGYVLTMPYIDSSDVLSETSNVLNLPWSCRDWTVMGIQQSHNKIYLLCSLYPSKFYCFRLAKLVSLVHCINLKSIDDVSHIILNHEGTSYSLQDAFCYMKYELAKGAPWPDYLIAYITNSSPWGKISISKLQIIRSLLLIYLLYSKTEDPFNVIMNSNVKKLDLLLLNRRFLSLFENDHFDSLNMKAKDQLMLAMIRQFLKSTNTALPRFLTTIKPAQTVTYCPACKTEIPYENHEEGTCRNGHSFERCCQTLLLTCDIPYRCCLMCNRKFVNYDDDDGVMCQFQSDNCPMCGGKIKPKDGFQ